MSVFRSDVASPRATLQDALNFQFARLKDPDPDEQRNARRWLKKHGSTVEELVANRWRIAELPISAITPEMGLSPVEPDATGHLEILGAQEDFETWGGVLADQAEILSPDRCLE